MARIASHRLGEIEADREANLQLAQGVGEVVRGPARVGACQYLHPPGLIGQLGQRRPQHGNMVGRGVGTGAAGSEHPGQRFAAGLQVAEQRVEPEAALEVARRALLLGVSRDQRGVEVEDDLAGGRTSSPGLLASSPPRLSQARQLFLRAHRKQQAAARLQAGAVWTDLDLVFTEARGYPHNHDRVRRAFYKALGAAGVRPVVLYALRHTMATLVLHETKDLKLVATRLGHSNEMLVLAGDRNRFGLDRASGS
jgi:hypothetical protein